MAAAQSARVLVFQEASSLTIVVADAARAATTTFSRPPTDQLGATLVRMGKKLGGDCALLDGPDGQPLPADAVNQEAWAERAWLRTAGEVLPISVNLPRITAVQLHTRPMVGCMLLPVVKADFVSPTTRFLCQWWRHRDNAAAELIADATELAYTPTEADMNAALTVKIMPVSEDGVHGLPMASSLPCVTAGKKKAGAAAGPAVGSIKPEYLVRAFPGFSAAQMSRHAFCQLPRAPGVLRVVTYNILLDAFCDGDWAIENLYPYLAREHANEDYRKQVMLRELRHFAADIICMQEVSRPLFDTFLRPQLARDGYEGVYANKKSEQPFGNAVFFRTAVLQLEAAHVVDLTQEWRRLPCASALVEADASMAGTAESSTTVAQVLRLRQGSRTLAVVNAHLFSHPLGQNIRILQAATALDFAARECPGLPLIMCGDFNAEPGSGMAQFLTQGAILETHPEWAEACCFAAVPSDTQEQRESNWHSVLRDDDFALLRVLFRTLDPDGRGHVMPESCGGALAALLPPGQPANYADFVVAAAQLRAKSLVDFSALVAPLEPLASAAALVDAVPLSPHGRAYPRATLAHGLQLQSALAVHPSLPVPLHTYMAGRDTHGSVLDYVLFSSSSWALHPQQPPLMPAEAITAHTGIPSVHFPSDHVAVVIDLLQLQE